MATSPTDLSRAQNFFYIKNSLRWCEVFDELKK